MHVMPWLTHGHVSQKSSKRSAAENPEEAAKKERKTKAGDAKAAREKRLIEGSPTRDGAEEPQGEFVIRSSVSSKRAKKGSGD